MDPRFTPLLARLKELRFDAPLYVTRPNLPPLETVAHLLEIPWERQWLSNEGSLHRQLESELCAFLGIPRLHLFCNGTIALLTALQALSLEPGEVITTPFTFPATVNALYWNRLRPVFCDIQPETYNLNPDLLESLIGPETRAILPVHVYGTPCDVDRISAIAKRHGLPVVYDGAHAFGVRYRNKPLLSFGDISMLSFHATKLFTTAEGGALAASDPALCDRIHRLRNFGISGTGSVTAPGINGKMSELSAALGLAQLPLATGEMEKRKNLTRLYKTQLENIPGLRLLTQPPDVESNHAYFPVRISAENYGMGRDLLHEMLLEFNVHCRKYFYPLCSSHEWCSQSPEQLPEAVSAAEEVLCLPLYGSLPPECASTVCAIIRELGQAARNSA